MMRFGLVLVVLLAAAVPAASASVFEAPVELGTGGYGVSVAGATDDAGRTTAVLSGVAGGTRIVQRVGPGVPWAASQPLPGAALGRAAGPVVAAGGQGALALAWRIDSPKRYSGIAVAVADPGRALGEPVVVSDPQADGVRHPAVATDASGHAVLAYNTDTRAVHLSLAGGIAVSLRDAGGPFRAPIVVDAHPSARPAVAIADDGRGVVAWTHDRRVWAVSFDAGAGTVGKVVALTGAGPHASVVAAAGPDGAATVAWLTHRTVGKGRAQTTRYEIQAAHRVGGGASFGKAPLRIRVLGYTRTLVAGADGQGTTVLAWTERTFDKDRNVGINGITASVRSATIEGGQARFEPVRRHVAPGGVDCGTPAVAARAGRAVIGWACNDRSKATVYTQAADEGGAPTPVLSYRLNARILSVPTPVVVGLDGSGATTVLTTTADLPDPTKPQVTHVLATTGR